MSAIPHEEVRLGTGYDRHIRFEHGTAREVGAGPWLMPVPGTARPSPELLEQRRRGRDAYERAMRARGVPDDQLRVYASAHWLFGDLGDEPPVQFPSPPRRPDETAYAGVVQLSKSAVKKASRAREQCLSTGPSHSPTATATANQAIRPIGTHHHAPIAHPLAYGYVPTRTLT